MSASQFTYMLFVYVRNSLCLLHSMSGQSVPHVDTSWPKFESACPRQTRHHFLSVCVSNRTLIDGLLSATNCVCHLTANLHDDTKQEN